MKEDVLQKLKLLKTNKSPGPDGQGSVLGPVLFVIVINGLPDITQCITQMFADDNLFFTSGNNRGQGKAPKRQFMCLV